MLYYIILYYNQQYYTTILYYTILYNTIRYYTLLNHIRGGRAQPASARGGGLPRRGQQGAGYANFLNKQFLNRILGSRFGLGSLILHGRAYLNGHVINLNKISPGSRLDKQGILFEKLAVVYLLHMYPGGGGNNMNTSSSSSNNNDNYNL